MVASKLGFAFTGAEPLGMRQTIPSRVALTRASTVSPAIEIASAAVGHRRHFPELAGVDGQSATMMRGVLDHGPDDVADGLAAHDRAGRKWQGEVLRTARAQKMDRVRVGRFEHLPGGGEGLHTFKGLGVFLKIKVETFPAGCAFDEPIESLGRVCDLLRDRHHAFLRAEPGVGLIENPG